MMILPMAVRERPDSRFPMTVLCRLDLGRLKEMVLTAQKWVDAVKCKAVVLENRDPLLILLSMPQRS